MKMSFKKFISYFGVSLLSFFLVLTLTTLVIHKVKSKQELDSLKEKGYYNLVSVGDYSLNVALFGNRESENVIVCIAGLGSGDFAVSMRQMTSDLEKENLLVFIDRAGYGLSEDTNKEMTNANIVEDYRLVLKNLEINGPYILMPHSIGGAYANYWCTKYPEEIKSVVFIDGSQLSENAFDDYEDEKVTIGDKILQTFAKMGFSRYVIRNYFYHLPSNYTDEEQYLADALMYKTFESIAPISEACLIKQNGEEAFEMITPNNIPKLYICSSWGITSKEELIEYIEWMNEQIELNNLGEQINLSNYTDEKINTILEDYEKTRDIIYKYAEKMGNCEVICLGGDHMIYEQKPIECGAIAKSFIDSLD